VSLWQTSLPDHRRDIGHRPGHCRGFGPAGGHSDLVARNRERGAAVLARIREETGSTCGEFLGADLSKQAEVRELAEEIQARYPHLDV